ncbi:MAG: acetyl-CoA carboxylase biotin carboxylase subunit, partial [Rhizomicrobium sp.]
MFSSLLIANRGEIACRVIRTARRMGLRTIAVYSDADAHALHVKMADEAVHIGPAPVRESYLRADAILAAAKKTKAEAIHPGYGFLSENAEFAEACAAAGIIFVGPAASAIRAMGLKDRAKALMAKAGVAVVPGYLGDDQSAKHLASEAGKIGYPVLIKAVAGGGGKGMRRVDDAKDFAAALEGAQREGQSSFGDARVLIEKYITRPRHIEMQVFGDSHGNVVHLFERDCSLQRRHQKVIEEATAPGMPEAMRKAMGEAAVKAAKAVGYVGAGTIEFIADASEGLKADRFWFMEMNTRLQVEHPVTEAITGYDLVEWQLRVASGEKLPATQNDIHAKGHAVEARLYAEDPQKGFLPSIGTLERLSIPEDKVRVDTGVREGDTISPFYDPMIAKVIAYADTREAAIEKLANALSESRIAGLSTNNAFLIRCLRSPDFIKGDIDTGFIGRHEAELIPHAIITQEILAAASGEILREYRPWNDDPWGNQDSFRLSGSTQQTADFIVDGKRVAVPFSPPQDRIETLRLANGDIAVIENGETFTVRPYDPFVAAESAGAASDRVTSPMPGKIIQLLVKP